MTVKQLTRIVTKSEQRPADLRTYQVNDSRLSTAAKSHTEVKVSLPQLTAAVKDVSNRLPLVSILAQGLGHVYEELDSAEFAKAVVQRAQDELLASSAFADKVNALIDSRLDEVPTRPTKKSKTRKVPDPQLAVSLVACSILVKRPTHIQEHVHFVFAQLLHKQYTHKASNHFVDSDLVVLPPSTDSGMDFIELSSGTRAEVWCGHRNGTTTRITG